MRWLRWLRWTLIVVAVLAAVAFGTAWYALRQSLPLLDGTVPVAGLSARATLERDARGIPVITATTRAPKRRHGARAGVAARGSR